MSRYSESVMLANALIEGRCRGSMFDMLYPFTTENISGYIDEFDLKNKSLLTVGSSSDQAINAFYKGCKDVTLLDKNILTKYYYFLKISAIQVLDRSEFLEYLRYIDYPEVFKRNSNALNLNTYQKLKETLRRLDYESFLFWDDIFNMYDPLLVRENLFNRDEERTNMLENMNCYLFDDESFNKCKDIIKNKVPTFIKDDVTNPYITSKFDNIWLSNIATYFDKYDEIINMIDRMYNLLNEDGEMLASYLYDMKMDTSYRYEWIKAYNIRRIIKLMVDYNPRFALFTGIKGYKFDDPEITDLAILCKKKLK